MGLSIFKIIGFLNVAFFLALMFFSKSDRNLLFIKIILFSFPFLNLMVVPMLDVFGVICFLFVFLFYKPRPVPLKESWFYRACFALLIVFVIIGMFVSDLGPGSDSYKDFINIFPIFIFTKVLIDEYLNDENLLVEIISILKIVLVFSFLFLVMQFIFGVQFSLSRTLNPNIIINGAFRYPSFFGDPQDYSQFLAIISFICLIRPNDEKLKPLNYLFVVLCVICILTTGGRAGLMGFLIGLSLILFFGNAKLKFGLIITSVAMYFIIMNNQDSFSIFKRGTDLDATYQFRQGIWNEAFKMFTDHPFFGIGIGNYSRHVTIHNPDQFWIVDNDIVPFDIPESGYLKFLSELGGTGFLCIFSLILYPIIKGGLLFLKTKDFTLLLIIAGLFSWFVGFNSNYSFSDARILLIIGLLISLLIVHSHHLLNQELDVEEVISEEDV